MYRVTKSGDKYFAVPNFTLDTHYAADDVAQLTEAGDPVILVEELEDLQQLGIDLDTVEEV